MECIDNHIIKNHSDLIFMIWHDIHLSYGVV